MSQIRNDFNVKLASDFIENIQYNRSVPYYFIGRVETWDTEPIAPALPDRTTSGDLEIRDNILYIRRIDQNNITLAARKYAWEPDRVFDQWDHTQDMTTKAFHCVTSTYNVYKCLNNNNGAVSTVEPSGNSLFHFTTADGYVWKYMYNIPIFKRRKFMSGEYMPVQRSLSDLFYRRGAVEDIVINDGGSGYE